MSFEPLIDDAAIIADIVKALEHSSDVITAMVPVVRTAYCNGCMVGFKAGQEDELAKHNGTYNAGK